MCNKRIRDYTYSANIYRYRADCVEALYHYKYFIPSIDKMNLTSTERKKLLKEKYSYWMGFKGKISGIIRGMERE